MKWANEKMAPLNKYISYIPSIRTAAVQCVGFGLLTAVGAMHIALYPSSPPPPSPPPLSSLLGIMLFAGSLGRGGGGTAHRTSHTYFSLVATRQLITREPDRGYDIHRLMVEIKSHTYPVLGAGVTESGRLPVLIDQVQKHDETAMELSAKLRHYITTVQAMNDAGRDLCNDFAKLYAAQEEAGSESQFVELANELKAHVYETDVGPLNNLVETLQRSVVTPLERWITETRKSVEAPIHKLTQVSTDFKTISSKLALLEKKEGTAKGLTAKEKERKQQLEPKVKEAADLLTSKKSDADELLGATVEGVWDTFDPIFLRFLDFRNMYNGHCHAQAHTSAFISVVKRRHQQLATTASPFMEFYPRTGYKTCEGWLTFKKNRLIAVRHRRYAVLRGTSLEMYESREHARAMTNCEKVRELAGVREREGQPKGFGFDVVGDAGAVVEFLADAESESEADTWYTAMMSACGALGTSIAPAALGVGGYSVQADHFRCDCKLTLAQVSAEIMDAPPAAVVPVKRAQKAAAPAVETKTETATKTETPEPKTETKTTADETKPVARNSNGSRYSSQNPPPPPPRGSKHSVASVTAPRGSRHSSVKSADAPAAVTKRASANDVNQEKTKSPIARHQSTPAVMSGDQKPPPPPPRGSTRGSTIAEEKAGSRKPSEVEKEVSTPEDAAP